MNSRSPPAPLDASTKTLWLRSPSACAPATLGGAPAVALCTVRASSTVAGTGVPRTVSRKVWALASGG